LLKELEDDERAGPVASAAVVILVDLQLVEDLSAAVQVVTGARVPAPQLIVDLVLNRDSLRANEGQHGVPRAVIGRAYQRHNRRRWPRGENQPRATGREDRSQIWATGSSSLRRCSVWASLSGGMATILQR
jgi:hypothetical protein